MKPILFTLLLGLSACYQNRFEVLRAATSEGGMQVLLDRQTGDVVRVDYMGNVHNLGRLEAWEKINQ